MTSHDRASYDQTGRRKKVGIMGGTFNPIHIGHLLLAENAFSEFGLDQVLFIPSGISYMKEQTEILEARHRLRMTQLSVLDNPHFAVSDMEVKRTGYTYTCDTIRQLSGENPDTDYFFLVGADTLFSMETWKSPELIFQDAAILAAVRDTCDREALLRQAEYLRETYGARVHLIRTGTMEISSSDIRRRLQEGRSIRYMVAEPVREYIESNHLYLQAEG